MRHFAPLALLLLGMAVASGAYLQALDYPFISDDLVYVTNNLKLRGLHWAELWRLFVEPYNVFEFLPLRDFSYWLDMSLSGVYPSAFRTDSILLYLVCCLLVYGATLSLWQLFRPLDAASAPWAAAAVALIFALHPAHVEAVVWISGRKDVLSGMFSALALWLAVSAKREGGLAPRYAAATMIALLAAMFSKATMVVVAPIIALLWMVFWKDSPSPVSRKRAVWLWIAALLAVAACAFALFTAHSTVREPAYYGFEAVTRALAILGELLRLAVTPGSRHFFYPVFESAGFPAMVALGGAVLLAAVAGTVALLRRRSLDGFALAALVLLCLPYMQLLPYGTHSLVSDRFLFLAVWPVALLLVALLWRLALAPRIVLLSLVILPLAFQTIERPRDWRSFDALTEADYRAYPGYFMPAACKVMYVQLTQGLYAEALVTANSIANPEVKDIMVKQVYAEHAVFVRFASTGNLNEATSRLMDWGEALKQKPEQAMWNAPMKRIWEKSAEEMENIWRLLAAKLPDNMSIRYNAGVSLMGIGRDEPAIAYLRAALAQPYPDKLAYCALAKAYRNTGRPDEAARADTECHAR